MRRPKPKKQEAARDANRVFIYCRFSPRPKAGSDEEAWVESAHFQEKMCRDHAARFGMQVAGVFVDEYTTGATMSRPQFDLMLNRLYKEPAGVGAVLAYDATRIGRTLMGIHESLKVLRELGVRLLTIKEGIDTSTVMGEMIMQMFAMMGEWERLSRAERTRESHAFRKALGIMPETKGLLFRKIPFKPGVSPNWREEYIGRVYRPGACPYGWSVRRWSYRDERNEENKNDKYCIEALPVEQANREIVLRMYLHEGESVAFIQRAMNKAGLRHRNSREWTYDHVVEIIRGFMIGGTIKDPLHAKPEFAVFIQPERAHEITKAEIRKSRSGGTVDQIIAGIHRLSDPSGDGQSRGTRPSHPSLAGADGGRD